jgi:serine phosphatase RsbU (regulator of sigma subunit)
VYLIDTTGQVGADELLSILPDLSRIEPADTARLSTQAIILADVDQFLNHRWPNPTIVLARPDQGEKLAKAWQVGALAGWMRNALPAHPSDIIAQLERQYLRHQDCRDLPSAARLQQQLLPPDISLADYQLERFFQPAAYLSGDWIDYWMVDERHLLFYLADVSGHGVTSSLLSTWMAAFHGRALTPQALLSEMNHLLVQQNSGKHITLICGLLDTVLHQVHWCSAGHYPPAILIHPHQAPETLTTSSFPLGLTPTLNVRIQTISLELGSRLIFCSDGVLEGFQGGLSKQLEQLIEQLVEQRYQPPDNLPDDLALLCLTRKLKPTTKSG